MNRRKRIRLLLFAVCFLLELFSCVLFPTGRLFFDPLLLFFLWWGWTIPSSRFLWLQGAFFGLFKDLVTGGLFGVFSVGFSGVGWAISILRNLMEREDPFLLGLWTAVLTGVSGLLIGILFCLTDPMIGWNRGFWVVVPMTMAIHGLIAVWAFPRMQRLCGF